MSALRRQLAGALMLVLGASMVRWALVQDDGSRYPDGQRRSALDRLLYEATRARQGDEGSTARPAGAYTP